MRTTIDLPDDLYRSLKARAAQSDLSLRELVQGLIEQGLRMGTSAPSPGSMRRGPPPLIIAPRGLAQLPQ